MLHALLRSSWLLALTPVAAGQQAQRGAEELVYWDAVDAHGRLYGGRVALDAPVLPPLGDARPAHVTTLFSGGASANRVDLVVVGDGYSASQIGTFHAHAINVVAGIFAEEPFATYQSYFCVHQVDVVSNESGVDNDPTPGIDRDTALDMAYWCGGTERLLCIDVNKAYQFANNAPDVDQVLALANSSKYGGAGYTSSNLATSAGANASAIEIVKHELGHSMGDLADEYTYGGPATWTGGEPSARNLSTLASAAMAAAGAKWAQWLGTNVPGFDGLIGTYEGGGYSEFGVYRPTANSLMRNLGRPFNLVSVESLLIEFYRTVDPIDAHSDTALTYGGSELLSVSPMAPGGSPLPVQWFLDGTPLPGATAPMLDLATLGLAACDGPRVVSVRVHDPTPWVRDEAARAQWMSRTLAFDVLPGGVGLIAETCPSTPNTVGPGVQLLAWTGGTSVSARDLGLLATGGPPGQGAIFYYGTEDVLLPFGNGERCVGGATARLPVTPFDGLGAALATLDWDAYPMGAGPLTITSGDVYFFQVWYRDPLGSPATFDLSNGLRIQFCD
jgi:hypothetical protein